MKDIKLVFLLSQKLSFLLFIRAGFVQMCCAMGYFKSITYSRCQNDSNNKGTIPRSNPHGYKQNIYIKKNVSSQCREKLLG